MRKVAPGVLGVAVTAVLAWPLAIFECWIYGRGGGSDSCLPLFFVPVAIAIGMLAGLMLHWGFVKRNRGHG